MTHLKTDFKEQACLLICWTGRANGANWLVQGEGGQRVTRPSRDRTYILCLRWRIKYLQFTELSSGSKTLRDYNWNTWGVSSGQDVLFPWTFPTYSISFFLSLQTRPLVICIWTSQWTYDKLSNPNQILKMGSKIVEQIKIWELYV